MEKKFLNFFFLCCSGNFSPFSLDKHLYSLRSGGHGIHHHLNSCFSFFFNSRSWSIEKQCLHFLLRFKAVVTEFNWIVLLCLPCLRFEHAIHHRLTHLFSYPVFTSVFLFSKHEKKEKQIYTNIKPKQCCKSGSK